MQVHTHVWMLSVDDDARGNRLELNLTGDAADVRISYHRADPSNGHTLPPLLLVHSVNAVGSAAEVLPLFNHYRNSRPVYALDLPGFGGSQAPPQTWGLSDYAAFIADFLHKITGR